MGGHDIKTDGALGLHMSCVLFFTKEGKNKVLFIYVLVFVYTFILAFKCVFGGNVIKVRFL